MRTLTDNELHRLRHVVAEQANDAQRDGVDVYLRLGYHDAQDVADALEELVALRTSEEDAANAAREKQMAVSMQLCDVEERFSLLQDSVRDLRAEMQCLRKTVEG